MPEPRCHLSSVHKVISADYKAKTINDKLSVTNVWIVVQSLVTDRLRPRRGNVMGIIWRDLRYDCKGANKCLDIMTEFIKAAC